MGGPFALHCVSGFLAAALLLPACFDPAHVGLLCGLEGGPEDRCASGLICIGCICEPPGTAAADIAASISATQWGEVTTVPGDRVNTGQEDDPSWTPDRLTIVFASRRDDGRSKLFKGTRTSPAAGFEVQPLEELNSAARGDVDSPEINADGTTIYFVADRDGDGTSNVYMSRQLTSTAWGTASPVSELSDATADDRDVAVSPDGLTSMIARVTPPAADPSTKIMIATRLDGGSQFGPLTALPSLGVDVGAPSLTNNADMVYFHGGEPRNLYQAWRTANGMFTPPMPISELNTEGRDSAPFVSADGCYLLFSRGGNIYQAVRRPRPARDQ